jgi:hypothetical protein
LPSLLQALSRIALQLERHAAAVPHAVAQSAVALAIHVCTTAVGVGLGLGVGVAVAVLVGVAVASIVGASVGTGVGAGAGGVVPQPIKTAAMRKISVRFTIALLWPQ